MVFSLLRNEQGLIFLICLWFVGERGTKREAGVGIGEMAAVGFFGGGRLFLGVFGSLIGMGKMLFGSICDLSF